MTADTAHPSAQPGWLAYFAYAEAVGWRTHDGRPMPAFGELGERIQHGWAEAARVAVERATGGPAEFDTWAAAQLDLFDDDLDRAAAKAAWQASADRFGKERSLMLDDLGDLLRALGLFDGAQAASPHQLMQDAIAELHRRLTHDMRFPDIAPATVTCSLCGAPLTGRPVPAGEVFVLEPHNCPNAPGLGIAYRTSDGQVWAAIDVVRVTGGPMGNGYQIGAVFWPDADVTIIGPAPPALLPDGPASG